MPSVSEFILISPEMDRAGRAGQDSGSHRCGQRPGLSGDDDDDDDDDEDDDDDDDDEEEEEEELPTVMPSFQH